MSRKKRSIAFAAILAAVSAAFVVVPTFAAPALASDTSTASSLFAKLNAERESPSVNATGLSPNGYVNINAQELAVRSAGTGHPCGPVSAAADPVPGSSTSGDPQFRQVICVDVSSGSSESSRLWSEFLSQDRSIVDNDIFYNYAGVGVFTKGSKVYAAIDLLGYDTSPNGYLAFAQPTISGSATVGHTLTVHYSPAVPDDGTVSGIHYSVAWITGGTTQGTGATFTIPGARYQDQMQAAVTISKTGFTTRTVTSAYTKQIGIGTFSVSGGSSKITQTGSFLGLATIPGVTPSAGTSIAYQWYVGSTAKPGQTSGIYAPVASDIGHELKFKITYTANGYTTKSVTYSTAGDFAGLKFTGSFVPAIDGFVGSPKVGDTLTSTCDPWNPTATFTYKWKANGTTISGQHNSTLVVTHSMIGKKITVTYTGSHAVYIPTSHTSASTPKVVS